MQFLETLRNAAPRLFGITDTSYADGEVP